MPNMKYRFTSRRRLHSGPDVPLWASSHSAAFYFNRYRCAMGGSVAACVQLGPPARCVNTYSSLTNLRPNCCLQRVPTTKPLRAALTWNNCPLISAFKWRFHLSARFVGSMFLSVPLLADRLTRQLLVISTPFLPPTSRFSAPCKVC